MTSEQILNREFLEIRAKILELAASFDRLDRAGGSPSDEPRLTRIQEALTVLKGEGPHRAEQVQLIFSRPYEDTWPAKYGLTLSR
jgi:predicted RecB family endonuclease